MCNCISERSYDVTKVNLIQIFYSYLFDFSYEFKMYIIRCHLNILNCMLAI